VAVDRRPAVGSQPELARVDHGRGHDGGGNPGFPERGGLLLDLERGIDVLLGSRRLVREPVDKRWKPEEEQQARVGARAVELVEEADAAFDPADPFEEGVVERNPPFGGLVEPEVIHPPVVSCVEDGFPDVAARLVEFLFLAISL